MRKSKLQIRLEKHRKREQRKKLIKATIKGTVKNTTVFMVSAALAIYPMHFPKTTAYFTASSKTEDPKKLEFKSDHCDFQVQQDEFNYLNYIEGEDHNNSFNIVINEFSSFDINDVEIEYVQLFCGDNSLVKTNGFNEKKNGKIVLSFDWDDIEALFDDIDDNEDTGLIELIGKGEIDDNGFFFKGSTELYISNSLSIIEVIGLDDALTQREQSLSLLSTGGDLKEKMLVSLEAPVEQYDEPKMEAISMIYTVEDQNGKPIRGVHWSVEDNDYGITVNSNTGEVTIPPHVYEGTFTLVATYRNILGRVITEKRTVDIDIEMEQLEESIVASVEIFGPFKIEIPIDRVDLIEYEAIVLNANGEVLGEEEVKWSLVSNIEGISINEKTGRLRVSNDAQPGTILIKATSASNSVIFEEYDIDLLLPEIEEELEEEELLDPEEMLREEELEELEEDQELDEDEDEETDELDEEVDSGLDETDEEDETGEGDENTDDSNDIDEENDDHSGDEQGEYDEEDEPYENDYDETNKTDEEDETSDGDDNVDDSDDIDKENDDQSHDEQGEDDDQNDIDADDEDGRNEEDADGSNDIDEGNDDHGDDGQGEDDDEDELDEEVDGRTDETDEEDETGGEDNADDSDDIDEENDDQGDTDEEGTDGEEGRNEEEPDNKPEDNTNNGKSDGSSSRESELYSNNQENRSIDEEKTHQLVII